MPEKFPELQFEIEKRRSFNGTEECLYALNPEFASMADIR